MKASLSRILVGLLATAGLIGASVNAQAATATGNFNVSITLTSKCEINSTAASTGAVVSDIALAYTSFQTTAATGSTSFNVRCTNSLPYTLALGVQTACLIDKPIDSLTVSYTSPPRRRYRCWCGATPTHRGPPAFRGRPHRLHRL